MMSDQESALLPGPASLPNRRRLEKDGVRFTHAFCNTHQCSAARSALLTGLEPHRAGVVASVKGPLMYEEEIRIPLVIRAPGLSGPHRRDDLVTQADLAPTLASLAGIRWPSQVAGDDLSKGPLPRDAVFLEYHSKQKWVNPIRTIRTHRWKLNWYDRGHKELYDLQADPHETRNLAGMPDVRAIQSELEARLNAWHGPDCDCMVQRTAGPDLKQAHRRSA